MLTRYTLKFSMWESSESIPVKHRESRIKPDRQRTDYYAHYFLTFNKDMAPAKVSFDKFRYPRTTAARRASHARSLKLARKWAKLPPRKFRGLMGLIQVTTPAALRAKKMTQKDWLGVSDMLAAVKMAQHLRRGGSLS